ncbi:hypothetical protein GGR28_003490 [Lewinella aquimaris]|uniref:CAAX prenyl protease 2/Lysostaphin resistance protein A-like domain-containing protein n=1 Tax=Neolewinella aquimaris TaxID=1835722 RepID=A0A840E6Q2_9BACT|nr:CPBP family intramembrane glutamic endopeptidase [Neolewinella aquimaris]MBB4080851.1 hypothetical protein [Neolewinella aquimaris]
MNHDLSIIRPPWSSLFGSAWAFGIVLIFAFGIPRFGLVLSANVTGQYGLVSLFFVAMWCTPWVFLTRSGRDRMEMKWPARPAWLLSGFVLGGGMCFLAYLVATLLYGDSVENWFVYISESYANVPSELAAPDRLVYFLIYAVVGMTFSPIGEEFFYRGVVHECIASQWTDTSAALVDSLAFSVTHLAHFGLLYTAGQWRFAWLPAAVWMGLLFLTCLLFFAVRRKAGSIFGAVACHAGFNLAMAYFIFFHVL